MKKFIFKLIVFLAIIICADSLTGNLYYLYDYVKGGEIGKIHQVMTKAEGDIMILGSSKAYHHFNSKILSDAIGCKVYNAGIDGRGSLTEYCFIKGIFSRFYPKVIVIELTPGYDIYKNWIDQSMNFFAPYKHKYGLDSLFLDIDPTNNIKMLSNAYQYNSSILRILPNMLSVRRPNLDGYAPLFGVHKGPIKSYKITPQECEIEPLKYIYFIKVLDEIEAHNIPIIFTISPALGNHDINYYKKLLDVAKSRNIPVFNHLNDTLFIYNPSYYSDTFHMNAKGADAYSKIIGKEISNYLKENNINL